MNGPIGALKALRMAPILNGPATSALWHLFGALGIRSEFVIRHLPRVGPVERSLPNGATLRLWSLGDDWIANQVFWRGWSGHEPETSSLFFRLASQARTVLDIGAHVGYYALLAALANPGARVYAFEPLPVALERLRRNITLNDLGHRITCLPIAVGAAEETGEFFHPGGAGVPSSASLSKAFATSRGFAKSELVPVVTIDRFVREHAVADVDLVKIDTETTEPDVIRGMAYVLRRDRPRIVCEVLRADTGEALEELLGAQDYRYYVLGEDGLEERLHIRPEEASPNYLFAPAERPPCP